MAIFQEVVSVSVTLFMSETEEEKEFKQVPQFLFSSLLAVCFVA
jgi:hypothetical protein